MGKCDVKEMRYVKKNIMKGLIDGEKVSNHWSILTRLFVAFLSSSKVEKKR
jgi:hypothetical protein